VYTHAYDGWENFILYSLIINQVQRKEIMTVTVFGYLILISIDFYIYSLVLVSIEKIYETLKTVFDQIFKHLVR